VATGDAQPGTDASDIDAQTNPDGESPA
jgi:hypothetical protein